MIVLGAGAGERLGAGAAKALVDVGGRPMLALAVSAAAAGRSVGSIIVTAPADQLDASRDACGDHTIPIEVIAGGATRQASVHAALALVPDDAEIVVVHDAARPFASPALFDAVIAAVRAGAAGAVPVMPVPDTVKRVENGRIVGTVDRSGLGLAQTPQAFRASALRRAHDGGADGATDDAMLLEADADVRAVPGEPDNRKITTLDDLEWARAHVVPTRG